MTVRELIEKLQHLDPDIHVFVHGYEGGYANAGPIVGVKEIALDVHDAWYYGPHEDVSDEYHVRDKSNYKIVKGIVL